ncbi:hypothetical protein KC19_VG083000 [Ceratodon purpureus]|uniref:Uncharacterized protein n=1 Tax=Ceratodon purpureus TaxID=3225 RepID=A0A8T0HNS4_CERPU|nr:hypothetical protein KC19_VG083000 [Ceratodon purpureus]
MGRDTSGFHPFSRYAPVFTLRPRNYRFPSPRKSTCSVSSLLNTISAQKVSVEELPTRFIFDPLTLILPEISERTTAVCHTRDSTDFLRSGVEGYVAVPIRPGPTLSPTTVLQKCHAGRRILHSIRTFDVKWHIVVTNGVSLRIF